MSVSLTPCPRDNCTGTLRALLTRDGSAVEGEVCGTCGASWMHSYPKPLPSAPRHDAGTGDHPAPTDATAPTLLPGETQCPNCGAGIPLLSDRLHFCASPPPSLGGEDAGALLEERTPAVEAMEQLASVSRLVARMHTEIIHYERRSGEVLDAIDAAGGFAHEDETQAEVVSRLAAANASLRAQLAAASDRYARAVADADEVRGRLVAERDEARRMIEEFRDASGLCVPAEERGGDPGGVQPRHLAKYIADLEVDRDACKQGWDEARRSRDAWEDACHKERQTVSNLRGTVALMDGLRADVARLKAERDEARGKALEESRWETLRIVDAEVVQVLDEEDDGEPVDDPEVRLSTGLDGDEILVPAWPGAKYGDKVEIVVRALAAPAAKGGA